MKKLGLLFLFLLQFSCSSQKATKINGVSFVASREEATQEHIDNVKYINANHAAIMPFGFIRNISSPEIIFNTDRQWFGETKKGAKQYVELLHKNKIKVMLKPQIWIWRGKFTGTLKMNSEEDWVTLEKSYEKFIITYAQLAEETKVELLCIGTELEKFVNLRPAYWEQLITKIRKVYKGQLTYAANWDEYPKVAFWSQLDFIGIDAYFPLSESKTPTLEELKIGWQPWKRKIKSLSNTTSKPVIFTEFGYRSMDYTAKKPWLVDRTNEAVNLIAQANAKEAIFLEFWQEEWFAGGYVWKWFLNHENVGGQNDNRFTPQNKPAQEVIKKFYKIY
ncbi:glycoside hydrolase TIM-barrel-like domain-containing protein [Maribacter sp.]|uniref:glycoside hydrolase family 113 n=1 Tax=Maribacter sp. TaxID=1897614 RepID=UPI0025BC1581|nr:glycoside hydrolase TIM-barrel-like domain-containing protein [Maribacter sp.]